MDAEGGWQEAVEVTPDIVPNREIITTHSFDLTVTPPQIVWGKRDVMVNERKDILRNDSKKKFEAVVREELRKELDEFPETQYDAAVVDAARAVYENEITQINALETHDQADAFEAAFNA